MYDICGFAMNTHVICGKEIRPKGQVAIHEASTYYTHLGLLWMSASWMMLMDESSSFMLM